MAFKVILKKVHVFDGNYGETGILMFTTTEEDTHPGYSLKWFTQKFDEFEPGDTYNITATIKDFQEYKGFKTTMVTRGKVN